MDNYLNSLLNCILFKSIEESNIKTILNSIDFNIKDYKKGEIIALEGSNCSSLGIILNGQVEIHKPFSSGRVVTINHFNEGEIFGEAIVFSGIHTYPATVLSSDSTQIMYIYREDIIKIMTLEPQIINNFIGVLSNRILMLNDRITNLSYGSLRKKISNLLLLEYNKQKTTKLILSYDRKQMAELLNIQRPSLSRELSNMQEDGLIEFNKNEINILDPIKLENSLIE